MQLWKRRVTCCAQIDTGSFVAAASPPPRELPPGEQTDLDASRSRPLAPAIPLLMNSSLVARASADLLAAGGLSLLFASASLLPRLVPAFPPALAWLGQLIAAAWLGIALFNWSTRTTAIGGIHGRP